MRRLRLESELQRDLDAFGGGMGAISTVRVRPMRPISVEMITSRDVAAQPEGLGGAGPPAWFADTMNVLLRPIKDKLESAEQSVERTWRLSAIRDRSGTTNPGQTRQTHSTLSRFQTFGILKLKDSRHSPQEKQSEGLTAAQRKDYYNRYYPDGHDRHGNYLNKIYEAIVPKVDIEIAEAIVYERDITDFYASELCGGDGKPFEKDVVEASVYKRSWWLAGQSLIFDTAIGLVAAQPDGRPAPLRPDTMNDLIKDRLDSIEKSVERTWRLSAIRDRRSALRYNKSRADKANPSFNVVLFPDFRDPEARPSGRAPALISREIIEGLAAAQRKDYYKGYYPNGHDRRGNYLNKIYEAIGVRRRQQTSSG
ncbi:hypothetical protein BD779DRAFT_1476874 [Infundibulicybe gibba]|nr:hypothetical protein BD779DRAFT_1476874 [Infundibulicybe gibba]